MTAESGPAVVVIGSNVDSDGVEVWYTEDASNIDTTPDTGNSYQISNVEGINVSQISANDFKVE